MLPAIISITYINLKNSFIHKICYIIYYYQINFPGFLFIFHFQGFCLLRNNASPIYSSTVSQELLLSPFMYFFPLKFMLSNAFKCSKGGERGPSTTDYTRSPAAVQTRPSCYVLSALAKYASTRPPVNGAQQISKANLQYWNWNKRNSEGPEEFFKMGCTTDRSVAHATLKKHDITRGYG